MIFLPYGYFVELQVHRNKPWDPGIIFGSCSLNAQHLEDKVFLMGQGVIGKHDRMPEPQEKEIVKSKNIFIFDVIETEGKRHHL